MCDWLSSFLLAVVDKRALLLAELLQPVNIRNGRRVLIVVFHLFDLLFNTEWIVRLTLVVIPLFTNRVFE